MQATHTAHLAVKKRGKGPHQNWQDTHIQCQTVRRAAKGARKRGPSSARTLQAATLVGYTVATLSFTSWYVVLSTDCSSCLAENVDVLALLLKKRLLLQLAQALGLNRTVTDTPVPFKVLGHVDGQLASQRAPGRPGCVGCQWEV